MGLIYHRPQGFSVSHTCLMMGEASLLNVAKKTRKNNMIQDMINSDNMNSTESTISIIFNQPCNKHLGKMFNSIYIDFKGILSKNGDLSWVFQQRNEGN